MSGKIREYIKIDINKGVLGKPYNYKIPAKLGDNGSRVLVFQLYSNDEPFVLTSSQTVRLRLVKPDGYEVLSDCKISNANTGTVEVTLSSTTLSKIGQAHGELMITSSSNYKLTTASFYINVMGCVSNGTATEGSNEFQALISGLDRLDKWDATFQTKYDTLESKYAEDLALCKEQVLDDSYTTTLTQTTSMSKVGVTDDIDVHASVRDGMFKSAILKGQTLVNLMTRYKDEETLNYAYPVSSPNVANVSMLKPLTDYTLFYKAKYMESGNVGEVVICTTTDRNQDVGSNQLLTTEYKQYVFKFRTLSTVEYFTLRSSGHYFNIKECVLLEGDHTNENVPYFTGMQSVKMPVLTTTGKNLYDINKDTTSCWNGTLEHIDGRIKITSTKNEGVTYHKTYLIPVKKGKTYRVNANKDGKGYFGIWKNGDTEMPLSNPFTVDDTFDSIAIGLYCSIGEGNVCYFKPQLEEGSIATSYEPYKSNILTVNEEVELRGIGDVKDELDLLTGELIQRVGGSIIDGSNSVAINNATNQNTTISFDLGGVPNSNSDYSLVNIISDKFPAYSGSYLYTKDIEGISNAWNTTMLRINRDRLNTPDAKGLKQWLTENPIKVTYIYDKESTKTVDLSGLPFAYQGDISNCQVKF